MNSTFQFGLHSVNVSFMLVLFCSIALRAYEEEAYKYGLRSIIKRSGSFTIYFQCHLVRCLQDIIYPDTLPKSIICTIFNNLYRGHMHYAQCNAKFRQISPILPRVSFTPYEVSTRHIYFRNRSRPESHDTGKYLG